MTASKRSRLRVLAVLTNCFFFVAYGCGRTKSQPEEISVRTAALTNDAATVLGFESPADWTASPVPAPTSSTTHSQGNASLAIAAKGFVTLTSRVLSSLGTGVPSHISVDIRLPTAQPNPSWLGAVQLFVTIPSLGINNAYLGQDELTGLPLNTFKTLSFTVPANVLTALRGTYSDLKFTVTLNVPSNATGTYLLDNLNVGMAPVAFDGQAAFQGLFFGIGPVADMFPDIYKGQPTLLATAAERTATANRMLTFANDLRNSATVPPSAPPATPIRIAANAFLPADTFGSRNDGAGVCGSFGVCNFGQGISFVENGDWVRYRSVNLGARGAYGILTTMVATPNSGGHVQVFVDGVPSTEKIARKADETGHVEPPLRGTKVAALPITATSTLAGDFSVYQPESTNFLAPTGGVHDVYVVFVKQYTPGTTGSGFGIGNFASFQFAPTVSPTGAADALTSTANKLKANGVDADSIAALVNRAAVQVQSVGLPPKTALAITQTSDRISAADSTFFARFGSRVQSGNPLLVSQALQEGSTVLTNIIKGAHRTGLPGFGPFPSEASGRFIGDDTDGTSTDTSGASDTSASSDSSTSTDSSGSASTSSSTDSSASTSTSTDSSGSASTSTSTDSSGAASASATTDTSTSSDLNTSTDTSAENDFSLSVTSSADTDNADSSDLDLIKDLENAALCVDVNGSGSASASTNRVAQTDTFVQFNKVLQFDEDFQFGILIILILYIAVVEVVPAAQKIQTILDPSAGDPLQRELFVNEVSLRLNAGH